MIRVGFLYSRIRVEEKYLLEKLGAVIGVSNLHIYAAMRGETLEEFQKTRNAQVLYSVAGDSKQMTWDKEHTKPAKS